MDTRAYRLARRSDIPVFEVDLPVNIERKKAAVQRAIGAVPASVHLVPLDFERDDLITTLTGHGYRTDARTFFIWEGVTQYLTENAVRATLGALRARRWRKPAGVHLRSHGTSSTGRTCTTPPSCTSVSGNGSRCGASGWTPTRFPHSSPNTAGDSSSRRGQITSCATTFGRQPAISQHRSSSGRRTRRRSSPDAPDFLPWPAARNTLKESAGHGPDSVMRVGRNPPACHHVLREQAATTVVRSSALPRLVGVCRLRAGNMRDLLMWSVGATADLESAGMPRRVDGLGTR